jgi:hypothetical protein
MEDKDTESKMDVTYSNEILKNNLTEILNKSALLALEEFKVLKIKIEELKRAAKSHLE